MRGNDFNDVYCLFACFPPLFSYLRFCLWRGVPDFYVVFTLASYWGG